MKSSRGGRRPRTLFVSRPPGWRERAASGPKATRDPRFAELDAAIAAENPKAPERAGGPDSLPPAAKTPSLERAKGAGA